MNAFSYNGLRRKSYKPFQTNEKNELLCCICGRPAFEHCYSEAGRREVTISGVCEECFDKMTDKENKN